MIVPRLSIIEFFKRDLIKRKIKRSAKESGEQSRFMGSATFAIPTGTSFENGHAINGATQPDKPTSSSDPAGSWKQKAFALHLIYQPKSPR
jgi:hypothetical protein